MIRVTDILDRQIDLLDQQVLVLTTHDAPNLLPAMRAGLCGTHYRGLPVVYLDTSAIESQPCRDFGLISG